MKVIIAYDGSTCADAAIDDLPRAGFPADSEIVVVSVADFSVNEPTLSEFALLSPAARRVDAVLDQAKQRETEILRDMHAMAESAADGIRRKFPDWTVTSEVLQGSPADVFLQKLPEWKPDLIMGGSQGRSAIGRFFMGSVSKSVAERAGCTVRVVKSGTVKTPGDPVEIVVGTTHPAEAERIARALSKRDWPEDTRIRFVSVDDAAAAGRGPAYCPDGKSVYESAAESVAAAGVKVSVQIEAGDPKTAVLAAADAWHADAIFVCASSSSDPGLDETASGLLTTAKCTVEIVR